MERLLVNHGWARRGWTEAKRAPPSELHNPECKGAKDVEIL
jgi:hypothetical protein